MPFALQPGELNHPIDRAATGCAWPLDVTIPRKEITIARPNVELTSARCSGVYIITASAPAMKMITAQVRYGNSHMRNFSSVFSRSSRRRMRSCEMAITMYTNRAMAPELASRNSNTPSVRSS